jgi:hypothetical protein
MFASLLDKREDTLNEPSESVLAAAVENKVCPMESIKTLLDYMGDTKAITKAVLIAALGSSDVAGKLKLLLAWSNDTPITGTILTRVQAGMME